MFRIIKTEHNHVTANQDNIPVQVVQCHSMANQDNIHVHDVKKSFFFKNNLFICKLTRKHLPFCKYEVVYTAQ